MLTAETGRGCGNVDQGGMYPAAKRSEGQVSSGDAIRREVGLLETALILVGMRLGLGELRLCGFVSAERKLKLSDSVALSNRALGHFRVPRNRVPCTIRCRESF